MRLPETLSAAIGSVIDRLENLGGWAIDDIESPGQPMDDAESDNGWSTSGFIRSTNVVSQRYLLQVVRMGAHPSVEQRAVDGGKLVWDLDAMSDRRLLAVTGFAVRTTQPTSFVITAEGR